METLSHRPPVTQSECFYYITCVPITHWERPWRWHQPVGAWSKGSASQEPKVFSSHHGDDQARDGRSETCSLATDKDRCPSRLLHVVQHLFAVLPHKQSNSKKTGRRTRQEPAHLPSTSSQGSALVQTSHPQIIRHKKGICPQRHRPHLYLQVDYLALTGKFSEKIISNQHPWKALSFCSLVSLKLYCGS